MSSPAQRYAVIGGGISGLTAAWEASKRGHQVEVFEAASGLGGLASSFDLLGAQVDRYYHFVCGADRDLVELLDELGLGHELHWRPTLTYQYSDGRMYPFGGALDLLRFEPMPLSARLRFGLHAAWCRFLPDWKSLDHRSAEEWLTSFLGKDGYEAIWGPLLRAKFGVHAGDISAPWIWHRVHRLGSSRRHLWSPEKLGYLAGGSGPLMEGLARGLRARGVPLHLDAPVAALAIEAGRVRGIVVGGEKRPFDRVIAATPLPVFSRLLPAEQRELAATLARIRFIGVVCVLLVVEESLTPAFWVNVNDSRVPFCGFIEYTNLDPLPALGGRRLVYVPYYVEAEDPLFHRSDEAVVEDTLAGLERILPAFSRSRVVERRVFRDRWAQPICPPGFATQVPPVATGIEGLFLVDSTQLYPADRSRSGMIGVVRHNTATLFGGTR